MGRIHEDWRKMVVTAYGHEIGDFLAEFFCNEQYKEYNENIWHNAYREAEPFDIYNFKEIATKYEVSVEFKMVYC